MFPKGSLTELAIDDTTMVMYNLYIKYKEGFMKRKLTLLIIVVLVSVLAITVLFACVNKETGEENSSGSTDSNVTGSADHNGTVGLEFIPLNDTECAVAVGSAKQQQEIVVPSTYKNYTVTTILGSDSFNGGFAGCTNLKSIEIPNTVTSIGNDAFSACIRLTSVNYLGTIEQWCKIRFVTEGSNPLFFANKLYLNGEPLTELIVPNTIKYINSYSFKGCSSLKSVVISDSVTSIGNEAFAGCSSLTSVVISDSVTIIGDYAFRNCSSLKSVVIPNSVTIIGNYAFSNCSSLKSVVIPDSVTSIESSAFEGCSSLRSVVIPDSVTSIESFAFYGCSSLTSVVIPDSVTSIDYGVFRNCSSLESITLPFVGNGNDETHFGYIFGASSYFYNDDRVPTSLKTVIITGGESIESCAFRYCNSLESIVIPDSVTNVGSYAFYECNSLTLYCEAESKPSGWRSDWNNSHPIIWCVSEIAVVDGVKYGMKGTNAKLLGYEGTPTELEIPSTITYNEVTYNVTSITNNAFSGCRSLTSVVIPDSVTSIGEYAFSGCSSLTSIVIPDSVTSIESNAFSGCYRLVEVYNLSSLSIVAGSYSNSGLGYYALDVYTSLDTPSKLSTDSDGCVIYTDEEEKILVGYTGSETELVLPNGITEIYNYAFYNCSSLESVVIPNSVTSIGDDAFSDCSSLESVVIPNSVTSIGDDAFSDCSSLISVLIPNSVTSIGNSAFNDCSSLTSVVIPGSVTSIEGYAFYNCYRLESIVIPNSVTSIGNSAFLGCSSLKSVLIPNSVTSIGNSAFERCKNLASVLIPNSVTSIGSEAFAGCSNVNIYCEAESKPSGWSYEWNYDDRPVEWGYKD